MEYHAVLASGPHWIAADVVRAMFAMRSGGGIRDSVAIEGAHGGGIMGDGRVLGKIKSNLAR